MQQATRDRTDQRRPRLVLAVGASLLLLASLGSLAVGAGAIGPAESLRALVTGSPPAAAATVLHIRLPRLLLGALLGAALAVAGSIMQSLTRNPLASPQTFGVNAAAALAMVVGIVYAPWPAGTAGTLPALLGAGLGGALVLALGTGRSGGTVHLALVGTAVHLLCTALIQAITVLNDAAVDVLFWTNGSLVAADWADVALVAPPVLGALVVAVASGRSVHLLGLGRETAAALGANTAATTVLSGVLVLLLAGSAVAVAGPIGFVGLIVPHVVRALVGSRPGWEVPLCAVLGAVALVVADIAARTVLWPSETPVGVLTALVGAPVFLLLARRTARGPR